LRRFLDTNILLYSISGKPGEEAKRDIAIGLIDQGDCALSVQVVQEFFVQATRQSRPDRIAPDQAMALIDTWRRFPIQSIDMALVEGAWEIYRAHRFSWWDSMIVAAARAAGCTVLSTEDLDHGRVIDSLRIDNPFQGLRQPGR
jgi:predicted nucleic acid-binding protein